MTEGDVPIREENNKKWYKHCPLFIGIIAFALTIQPWIILILWSISYHTTNYRWTFTFIPGILGIIAIIKGFDSLYRSENIKKKYDIYAIILGTASLFLLIYWIIEIPTWFW